jgi:ABC-type branched-subunit amino acid transport system substrate-binding protein
MLAAAEINEAGGILGRQVELVLGDGGATPSSAAEAAKDIVDIDGANAVIALLPSYQRGAIANALRGRVPYVYTPQFEGGENDMRIMTVGEVSEDLLRPGIAWIMEQQEASRFFLIGNEYNYPRDTLMRASRIIRDNGGQVVGHRLLPFGFTDYEPLMHAIRQARPDVVMPYLLGFEGISFNRAFAATGLAARILRFTSAIDEAMLYALGESCTENLFSTSAYYSQIRSRNNDAFLERYHACFGDTPPPANAFGQSCYEGIYFLAALAKEVGSFRPAELRTRVGRAIQARTARGLEPTTVAGAAGPIHLAVAEGHEFRLLPFAGR